MELKKIRTALGLLNSMVNCKESHSKESIQVLHEAMKELESIENPIKLEEGKTITIYL